MIEVVMNFDEMNVIPVGIEKVSVGDVELKFIADAKKEINKEQGIITISNAFSTSIIPSSEAKKHTYCFKL